MLQKSAQIDRRGFMFVLSSPSGAGKTTISRLLLEADDNLTMSISATTRPMRPKEIDGEDYYFIDKEKFSLMVAGGEFLECAEVFDHYYGTPEKKVNESLDAGIDVLFDIDWQGTQQVAKNHRDDLVSIFILPPSMQELENRLRKRAQDSDEIIVSRMSKASNEISHWHAYDYVLVNNDVGDSLAKVKAILQAERQKRIRQDGLADFVGKLLVER